MRENATDVSACLPRQACGHIGGIGKLAIGKMNADRKELENKETKADVQEDAEDETFDARGRGLDGEYRSERGTRRRTIINQLNNSACIRGWG